MWFSFVVDFIGIFFIVSFVFGDFELFQNLMLWEFIICAAPCTLCLGIVVAVGLQTELIPKYFACCTFPLLFAIFSFGWILSLSIINAAWFVLLFLNHGSVQRLAVKEYERWDSKGTGGREFYEKIYKWILEDAADVVDVEDNQVLIPKYRDRILRVCIVNKALTDKCSKTCNADKKDCGLMEYLDNESTTNYMTASWRGIRNHHVHATYGERGQRNAEFMRAFFYNFYADVFYSLYKERIDWVDTLFFIFLIPLTFLFGPFYLISRAFHLILPLLTPLLLDWNDWDSFQFIIWGTYSCFMVIWCCGMIVVCRREFYLLHILPAMGRLKEFKLGCSFDDVHVAIFADYNRITTAPIIRKMLVRHYGSDVANVILIYL